jgi:hypothetical protein
MELNQLHFFTAPFLRAAGGRDGKAPAFVPVSGWLNHFLSTKYIKKYLQKTGGVIL